MEFTNRNSYEEHQERVRSRKAALRQTVADTLGDTRRLTFEIGSGHGHWLVDYAAANPDRFCLGIDIIGERVEKACRKRERAELSNARFIRGEAFETLECLPEGVELEAVFILFPDPWPKKRHWKNRLINPRFLSEMAEFCGSETLVHFRTDHVGYFEWAKEQIAEHKLWQEAADAPWPFERQTVFEARADSYQSIIFKLAELV